MAFSMDSWDVYDDMNLYITPERFIVEPNGKFDLLIIDRVSNYVKVQAKSSQLNNQIPTRRVCGILGTVRLLGGQYLIVATHRLFVGILNGAIIWQLAGYDIIPYIPSITHLTNEQRQQNEIYLQMLRKTLDTKHFYFSYWYDLTYSQQRLHFMPHDFLKNGLFDRADKRFVWNAYLLKNFNCLEMRKFALPLMLGFVSVNQATINGQTFFWSIISRRSIDRAGVRLFSRGIDENGDVANFIETEQIIEFNGERISFVQTRGSIPFYWRQTPNLRYKPSPEIVQGKDHLTACAKHFEKQISLYGKQVVVNLINQKGAEEKLESAFATFVSQLNNPNLKYESFDFHGECKKKGYDSLNILIERLISDEEAFSVFKLKGNGNLSSAQQGVFRTNCIDCLDRTNVVQSMLARRSLNISLQVLGILREGQRFENASPNFEHLFKGVWADNADIISLQYSGTGALKTDFTRLGKRTKSGMAQDGFNSLTRYCLNNFFDGFRQDAIELFLGNYIISDGEGNLTPSPLVQAKGWKYGTFPSILLFAIAMFFASAIFPSEIGKENIIFLFFWGSMIAVTTSGIFRYGVEFVDWPRLRPINKIDARTESSSE